MTNLTPNHPAVMAATLKYLNTRRGNDVHAVLAAAVTASLPHLIAEDLPTRLVRDIQVRTLRAAALAATHEEAGIPWDHDWDRATVAAWLDDLADDIEKGSAGRDASAP